MANTRKTEIPCYMDFDFPAAYSCRKYVNDGRVKKVVYQQETAKEISKRQLLPSEVTLKNLIDKGIVINPSSVGSMFNETDIASIEAHNDRENAKVLAYVEKNKDNLKNK